MQQTKASAEPLHEGNGLDPFEGGHAETLDDLHSRGRFLLAQRRQALAEERKASDQAWLELARLATLAVRKQLPFCLREHAACAYEGQEAGMIVSIRLGRLPRIHCRLEPFWEPGKPELLVSPKSRGVNPPAPPQEQFPPRPDGYRLPTAPGRHWRVLDIEEPVQTIEEAVALAKELQSDEFEERWAGRRGECPCEDDKSYTGSMLLMALDAYISERLERMEGAP